MSRKNWTTEKLFFRFLTNKSEIVYWDNLRELRLRGGEDIFLRSYTLAKSDLTKEQVIGIDILAQLGAPSKEFTNKTLDLFFEILKIATNPDVLTSLLFGIGHNNNALNEEQIALIATFKTHENTEIRQGVVHALLAVDNDTAIKTLISLTSDKVDSIRDWATFGIGTQSKRSNKEILDALWLRVKDRNANTKYEAIVGLANRNADGIKEIISKELQKDCQTLIFDAIITLKATEFLPELKKQLQEAENDNNVQTSWKSSLKECIDELSNGELIVSKA